MTATLSILLACLCASCASATFYRDGYKIACFQGDMRGVSYHDGDIRWSADSVDHSAATKAQGEAATHKITAIGSAAAAAGVMSLLP